ncbi:serpin family protein [Lewinella cohaerens]|uniref:serpin family protein n=1 Tax=Lewinella cohaerens TaxID=70995 RepID=UPI0003680BA2|nr:serpin family protein [Lewinella cohaerens]
MKPLAFFLVLVTFSIACFQCEKNNTPPNPTPPIDFDCADHPSVCELTAANGHFAIDLFKTIHAQDTEDANVFISPFSISTALSMTMNGANGQTLTDMQTALRTGTISLSQINEAYQTLLDVLPQLDPATRLKIANSIWHQNDYPVLPAFLATNTDYYASEVLPVDFREAEIVDEVNAWIENNTEGLITGALGELPSNVVMLLINAIYFQGSWQTEFDPEDTQLAEFTSPNGPVDVEMMHIGESSFRYTSNELFQAIDLPYGDSIYSMSIFLPREGHNLEEVITEFSPENWETWQTQMAPSDVELFLPKFKLEYEIKLKSVLSMMGMDEAFSDRADFSQMINGDGVKIDDVIHKAFVEVNEEGTEAAAVTVVVIVNTSVPIIPVFRADQPFVFVIHDNKTKSILFMGKVTDPS